MLEAGLGVDSSQLHCLLQTLAGSESHKYMLSPGNQLWSQADLGTCWLCDLGQSHLTVPQFPHQANLSSVGLLGGLKETCSEVFRTGPLSHCVRREPISLFCLLPSIWAAFLVPRQVAWPLPDPRKAGVCSKKRGAHRLRQGAAAMCTLPGPDSESGCPGATRRRWEHGPDWAPVSLSGGQRQELHLVCKPLSASSSFSEKGFYSFPFIQLLLHNRHTV